MEKKEVKIFYLGIAKGKIYTGGRKIRKMGLPVRELPVRPEYPGGYLRIFYALLPEFAGRSVFKRKGRAWKAKDKQRIIQRTVNRANIEGYGEVLLSAELAGKAQEVPSELLAAYLHSHKPFEQVCICFSGDGGTFEAREAVVLLAPYLRRIRKVYFAGEEGSAAELFTDYLFYEYGIVPERKGKRHKEEEHVQSQWICLDFYVGESEKRPALPNLASYLRINHAQALKFLDTRIKNGYNTES